ncbi:MAG: PKD domain-containing protein [Pirellulaceae bacterium]
MDRSRQRNSRIESRKFLSVESLEDRRLLVTNVIAPVIEPFPAAQIRLAGGAIPADAAHTLFVTESLFDVTSTNAVPASPNQIGGFASADYHCTDEAFKAGLHADWDGITAVYKAILSSNEVNARDRFSIIGPVYNTNGQLLAWNRNDFWDGQLEHAVQFDANGRAITGSTDVWTGTDAFGRSTQATANNWTTALSDASIGNATRSNADWLLSNVATAAAPGRLYCISIPTGQQLSPGPFAVIDPPAQTKDTTPTIAWEAAARAVHYDVTIASDELCQKTLQSIGNVTQDAVTTIPLPTGSYFACVSATSASGEQTLASNSPFAFEIVSDIAQTPPVANIGGPYVSDEGQVIMFDGSESFDPLDPNAVLSYEWDFDFDGTFDPWSHYTESPALFSQADFPARLIALRVTNADGMSDVDFTTWQVNETPPHATFLALPAPSSDGLTIQFAQASNTGNLSESIVKWHWQFANLGQSDDPNPQYRFPTSGIYSVSLTVTDSDGSAFTTTQSVSVTDGTPIAHAEWPTFQPKAHRCCWTPPPPRIPTIR